MKNNHIATLFMTEEVQAIVKRSAKSLVRKYEDKDTDYDDLYNQSYLCFTDLMKAYRYDAQLEGDYTTPTNALLGYIGIYLPLRLESYLWEVCNIVRTKKGYKKIATTEFDPTYHGGSIKGRFERELEMNETIDDALFEITDLQRDLIIMEFFEEATPVEISDYFKITPTTYRKRKHDSLIALKKQMKADKDLLMEVV